jgi:hypothetical protein
LSTGQSCPDKVSGYWLKVCGHLPLLLKAVLEQLLNKEQGCLFRDALEGVLVYHLRSIMGR